MASQSFTTSDRIQILPGNEVTREQEAELMIRYTKMFTRELVFAVDLMAFVMELSNLRFQNFIYANCFGSRGPSDLDDQMKRFVKLMLDFEVRHIAVIVMEENLKPDRAGYEEFKSFVNNSAIRTEAMPYVACHFLLFCVLMAELCTMAYQRGLPKAPDFGIMLMCRIYSNLDYKSALPRNPWEGIKLAARQTLVQLEYIAHHA